MSAFRKTEIAAKLNDWLFSGRYQPPKAFRGNDQVEREEANSLLSVLLKYAPQGDACMDFVEAVIDRLEYQLETRTWPNKQEIGAACVNIRKERPSSLSSSIDLSPEGINSRRMQRGEPVGEGWLYGALAVDLISKGLIDEATMSRYRSGAYLARKSVYGVDAANKWEAEAKSRHDGAKAVYQARNSPPRAREISVPDMTADTREAF